MKTFTRIINGVSDECYISHINNGLIYYGNLVSGYENKQPTAAMAVEYYNRLRTQEQHGTIYIDGCTHGRSIPCTTCIVGEAI